MARIVVISQLLRTCTDISTFRRNLSSWHAPRGQKLLEVMIFVAMKKAQAILFELHWGWMMYEWWNVQSIRVGPRLKWKRSKAMVKSIEKYQIPRIKSKDLKRTWCCSTLQRGEITWNPDLTSGLSGFRVHILSSISIAFQNGEQNLEVVPPIIHYLKTEPWYT